MGRRCTARLLLTAHQLWQAERQLAGSGSCALMLGGSAPDLVSNSTSDGRVTAQPRCAGLREAAFPLPGVMAQQARWQPPGAHWPEWRPALHEESIMPTTPAAPALALEEEWQQPSGPVISCASFRRHLARDVALAARGRAGARRCMRAVRMACAAAAAAEHRHGQSTQAAAAAGAAGAA